MIADWRHDISTRVTGILSVWWILVDYHFAVSWGVFQWTHCSWNREKIRFLKLFLESLCNASKHKRRGKFLKFIFRESPYYLVYKRWQRKTKSVYYGVTSECKYYWFKILRTLAWVQRSNLVNFNLLFMG